jgi:diaminopimelate decarboxylase
VSVTLSNVFLSVISGTTPHASAARRLPRQAFSMTEIALPAFALRNPAVAKWVRDQNLAVDVRSSEDLGVSCATLRFPRPMVAISAGLAILGQEAA